MRILQALLALVVAGGLLSACELIGSEDDNLTELEQNRRRWAEQTSGNYGYELVRGCFCIHAGRFNIQVTDYAIRSVRNLDRNEDIHEEDFEIFQTIENMFDLIESAKAAGAETVDVEYHSMGYPTQITIDHSEAADDELSLSIENVTVPRDLPRAVN